MKSIATIPCLFFLCLLLLLSGCGSERRISLDPIVLNEINFVADAAANQGRPMPVNIVFAKNKEMLRDLEGFTAKGWFSVKETNLGNWQDSTVIQELTINPGERIKVTDFPEGARTAIAAVVYVLYDSDAPALNRLILNREQKVSIILGPQFLSADAGSAYLLTSPPEVVNPNQRRF